jgi:phage baseplate assembly protein W
MASTSSLIGMSSATGARLTGPEHCAQSIGIVLTTPIGSRVMRRGFGSTVPDLLDQPDNELTQVRLFAAVAIALMRWVPNYRLSSVSIDRTQPGAADLVLDGMYIDPEGVQSTLQLRHPITMSA